MVGAKAAGVLLLVHPNSQLGIVSNLEGICRVPTVAVLDVHALGALGPGQHEIDGEGQAGAHALGNLGGDAVPAQRAVMVAG